MLNSKNPYPQPDFSNSHPPSLKVEGLTVYQGNYMAIRDVSFELPSGTVTAVVGPNGAGKSTLVQAILGLIPRTAGTIEILGRPLERLGHRHRLGYMPQNFIFDRSFPISVAELVGLGWVKADEIPSHLLPIHQPKERQKSKTQKVLTKLSQFWQEDRERSAAVSAALKRVNAYHLRHQAIGTLSGGELKRVLLAYCLIMPRQLLVLDEAFAGVDTQGAADFYALLNELKCEENWTVLQVSHDIDMVSRHCDYVLCLNQTLVCRGTPEFALSSENLLSTYGPTFSRYRHHHG